MSQLSPKTKTLKNFWSPGRGGGTPILDLTGMLVVTFSG